MIYKTRVVSLVVLNILVSGCALRTSTRYDRNGPDPAYKQVQPASLSGYIRAVNQLSHENSIKHDEERAALLSREPELSALLTGVEQNPLDRESGLRLAAAYLDHELYWSAYELLTQFQTANFPEAEIDLNLARIWDSWGQFDLARQHAERAIANGAASSQAFEVLGRIHLHRHSLAEAIPWFLRAHIADPARPEVLANLGYVYMVQRQWNRARLYLERAIELDKSAPEVQNNLATVLSQLGDDKGALEHLLETSRPAVALNNMGVLSLRQQRPEEAQHFFEESLVLEPSYENARRNLQVVLELLPPPSIIELPEIGNVISPIVAEIPEPAISELAILMPLHPPAPEVSASAHPAAVQTPAVTVPSPAVVSAGADNVQETGIQPPPIMPERQSPGKLYPQASDAPTSSNGFTLAGAAGLTALVGLTALFRRFRAGRNSSGNCARIAR